VFLRLESLPHSSPSSYVLSLALPNEDRAVKSPSRRRVVTILPFYQPLYYIYTSGKTRPASLTFSRKSCSCSNLIVGQIKSVGRIHPSIKLDLHTVANLLLSAHRIFHFYAPQQRAININLNLYKYLYSVTILYLFW
jgi:hypothetical protein